MPVPEEEQKPSWASILRGPPKPEEPVVEQPVVEQPVVEQKDTPEEQVIEPKKDDIVHNEVKEDDIQPEQPVEIDQPEEPALEEQESEVVVVLEKEEQVEIEQQEDKIIEEPINEPTPTASPQPQPLHVRKPPVRRLNQTEAVVLPSNQQPTSLASVNVQFGSLNLNNGEEQEVKDENESAVEETVIVDVVETKEEPTVVVEEIVKVEEPVQVKPLPTPPPATTLAALNNNTKQPLPQAFQPQQPPPPQPQMQQPMQMPIQGHPQQIHLSQSYPPPPPPPQQQQTHIQQHNEPYSFNPYASYAPNLHTAVSGYTMGAPAEYIMYNTEPQRMVTHHHSLVKTCY